MKQSKEVKKRLTTLRKYMCINLFKSYSGWFQWKKINLTKGIGNTEVVLFPSKNTELNFLALIYLDEYLNKIKRDDVIILACDERVISSAHLFSKLILKKQIFSRVHAENLMQLYCLYKFTENLTIISLDEPYGRNAYKVVGKYNTSLEEVLKICIYGMKPESQAIPIQYNGKDKDIINFIEQGNYSLRRKDYL